MGRKERKVLGLDLSLTGTGYCVSSTHGEYEIWNTISAKASIRGPHRLFIIRSGIERLLDQYDPVLVCLEGYADHAKGRTFQLGELGGVVRLLLWERGIDYLEPKPTTVKKFLTDNGNAKKDLMILKAFQRFNREFSSNDECDAFALGLIGLTYLGYREPETPYERKSVKELVAVSRTI